jgi:TonB family protein
LAAHPTPARIGRYEVEEFIGQGGMGVVYRARDPQIDRHVAIKVMQAVDATRRVRFLQEMRLLGTLKHPNIVTVFDCGEHEQQPYLVMEYVEGITLVSYIHGVPAPIPHRLELVGQLCAALEYAHARHIVHRDIKPANLMLDREGALKVLDFGIARSGNQQVTETGRIVGTLKYMAPEQLDGQAVDHRADIFAVGLLLYEILSLRSAFPDGTAGRVMHAVMHEQPEPLSAVRPGLDPELDRIVSTALQKNPAQRYQDVAALAADVARVASRIDPRAAVAERAPVVPLSDLLGPAVSPAAETKQLTRWGGSWTTSDARHYLMAVTGLVFVVLASALLVRLLTPRQSPAPESQSVAAPAPEAGQIAKGASEAAAQPSPTSTGRGAAPAPPSLTPPAPAPSTGRAAGPAAVPSTTPAPAPSIAAAPSAQPATPKVSVDVPVTTPPGAAAAMEMAASAQAGLLFPMNPPPWWAGRRVIASGGSFGLSGGPSIQSLVRECDAGSGSACFDLATSRRLAAQQTAPDLTVVAALLRRACDAGSAAGCSDLGVSYSLGSGVARDQPGAISYYERACAAGAAAGCANLGVVYLDGVNSARDLPQAAKLFQRACDGGAADGCYALGITYAIGRGVSKDDDRARDAFARACDFASPEGCRELAHRLTVTSGAAKQAAALIKGLEQRAIVLRTSPGSPNLRPLRMQSGTPVKIKDAQPVYAAEAQAAKLQGTVTIELTIGVVGNVIDARVIQSIPGLDAAALDAVRQWEFAPTVIDGFARQVIATVGVKFPPQ